MSTVNPLDRLLGARSRAVAWAALAATIVLCNAGNLALDHVAKRHGLSPAMFLDPWSLLAIGCLGLGFFCYVKTLAQLPLAVAYPILVGVSIVMLTGIGIVSHSAAPSVRQGMGFLLVVLGIALISGASRRSRPAAAAGVSPPFRRGPGRHHSSSRIGPNRDVPLA